MYAADTSARDAALWGLKLEEMPDDVIEVWDINWPSFNVFNSLSSQWRISGMGDATGLDYNVIPVVAKMLGYKGKELPLIFSDIKVMENEALITMGENREDVNPS